MQLGSDREARIANAFVTSVPASPTGPGGPATGGDLQQFVQFLDRKMLTKNAIIGGVPLLHFMAGHARDDLVKELISRGASVAKTQQGLTPLHFAVSRDHSQCPPGDQERRVSVIRALVKDAMCQVNAQEQRGWTALKFAVRFRLIPCVQELLSLGANADLQDQEGFAPLHNAIGAVSILRLLLSHVRHVDAINHRKQTALIIALVNRDLESADQLLSNNCNTNVVDLEGNTPLILATRINNLKLAQKIINKGASPRFKSPANGRQALHYAAENASTDLAVWLVRHGADIFSEDSQGYSPIQLCNQQLAASLKEAAAATAVADGQIGYIQRLIDLGLDINATTGVSGAPLLHRASYCGHSDLVKFLLQNGASVSMEDNEGDSAIHYACLKDLSERNYVQALYLLLTHGGNPSMQNKRGDTPLHIAARQGFNHRVHMLLEHKADRTLLNKRGELALHRACGNIDAHMTVCMLLEGSPPNAVNRATEEGWTPLMYAAKAGAIEIAKFLVDAEADVNIRQRTGFTALHFAVQCNKPTVRLELCHLLLQHKACPNAPAGHSMLTPLHWACANALADVSKLLVEHGGDVYQRDKEGDTSLALIPASALKLSEALEEMSSTMARPVPGRQTSLPSLNSSSLADGHHFSHSSEIASHHSYDGIITPSIMQLSPTEPTASVAPVLPRRPPVPTPRRRKKTGSDGSAVSSGAEPERPKSMPSEALSKAAEAAAEAAGGADLDVVAAEAAGGADLDVAAEEASPQADFGTGPVQLQVVSNNTTDSGLGSDGRGSGYCNVTDLKPGLEESLYISQSRPEPAKELATAAAATPVVAEEPLEMLCLTSTELPKEAALGTGAYSDVYQSTYCGEKVAVKLFKNLSMDEVVDIFDKEVRLLSRLKHANVLRFIGYVTEPGFYAIITDLLERGSLYDILHSRSIELPWTLRLKMMLDAARGMEYLHSCQMLHRDLKSMNLLVSADWVVKVADFGLTKVRMHTQTMASSLKGTPAYMAPELLDSKPISEATDVYAFGIILYEVSTRKRPYHEHTLNAIQLMMMVLKGARPTLEPSDDIPEGLVDLAKRCWSDDFRVRPPFREICDWMQALNACVE